MVTVSHTYVDSARVGVSRSPSSSDAAPGGWLSCGSAGAAVAASGRAGALSVEPGPGHGPPGGPAWMAARRQSPPTPRCPRHWKTDGRKRMGVNKGFRSDILGTMV